MNKKIYDNKLVDVITLRGESLGQIKLNKLKLY